MHQRRPVVARSELPTADIVAVRHDDGGVTVFVDESVPEAVLRAFLDGFAAGAGEPGTGYFVGGARSSS